MSVQERFSEDWQMPLHEVQRLVRLAKRAKKQNEHACNGDPTDSFTNNPTDKTARSEYWSAKVDETTDMIAKLAARYGFTGIEYTGLGPTLKRGDRFIEIPY